MLREWLSYTADQYGKGSGKNIAQLRDLVTGVIKDESNSVMPTPSLRSSESDRFLAHSRNSNLDAAPTLPLSFCARVKGKHAVDVNGMPPIFASPSGGNPQQLQQQQSTIGTATRPTTASSSSQQQQSTISTATRPATASSSSVQQQQQSICWYCYFSFLVPTQSFSGFTRLSTDCC